VEKARLVSAPGLTAGAQALAALLGNVARA